MSNMRELLNFEEDGFLNIDIHEEPDCLRLRTNVHSREEFQRWKEIYSSRTNTCFNSKKLYQVGVRKTFHQVFVCHLGLKHKGIKKTSTGCQVTMDATIKKAHRRIMRMDQLVKEFPCFVLIKGHHNHTIESPESLSQLRVLPSTKEMFEKYFEQGLTVAQAVKHHKLKMDLYNDPSRQVNHAINPSPRSISYLRDRWLLSEHGGLNKLSMFEAINKYAKDNPEVMLLTETIDNHFCIVLVTPFMRRVHMQVQEAGEMVFVDSSGCVNQFNTAVIPLLCATSAGAMPLAVLFTSSQDEGTLTKGLSMVKEALGKSAFYGRGAPQSFMTNYCDAEKKALRANWPGAKFVPCIFVLLQQVWGWILDTKNGVKKHHRQKLFNVVKMLTYAESKTEFLQVWEDYQASPIAKIFSSFTRYLCLLVKLKEEWATAYRADAEVPVQEHHTESFCEAAMCVIKDIVLNRYRSSNASQLVAFMVEIFDFYMRQRLVDVALRRRHVKPMNAERLPIEVVTALGDRKYTVQSQSEPSNQYKVDLTIGTCTCKKSKGENGVTCKHQAVCAEYSMTLVPRIFVSTCESRQWLAALAIGPDKVLIESFFKSWNESGMCTENCKIKEENIKPDTSENKEEYITQERSKSDMCPENGVKEEGNIQQERIESDMCPENDENKEDNIKQERMKLKSLHDEDIPDEEMIKVEDEFIEDYEFIECSEKLPSIQYPQKIPDSRKEVQADFGVKPGVQAIAHSMAHALFDAASSYGNEDSKVVLNSLLQSIKSVKSSDQFNSLMSSMAHNLLPQHKTQVIPTTSCLTTIPLKDNTKQIALTTAPLPPPALPIRPIYILQPLNNKAPSK